MNRYLKYSTPALLALVLGSCRANKEAEKNLEILSYKQIPKVSSPSAVARISKTDYVIGDDVPYVYILENDSINNVFLFSEMDISDMGRAMSPPFKADVEAAAALTFSGKPFFTILSSGSTDTGTRDTIFMIDPAQKLTVVKKNIRPIYDSMRRGAGIGQVNIEGMAVSQTAVFLLHRGNHDKNLIFQFDRNHFFRFVTSLTDTVPAFKTIVMELPVVDGVRAGFSDALYMENEDAILFSATLENTSDALTDGKIMGSFIGIIPLSNPSKTRIFPLVDRGKTLRTKVEAITLVSRSEKDFIVRAYSDNDDLVSEELLLRFAPYHN